ncbi:polyprenyl synthetase family protein [Alteromonas flava]|uniref:polyprenyl synthetase family protein n=1 Tax=Alteromonas flava TaxID=2048003 RepID=UPI000C2859AA|nr:farnesyl diphosphate synthase [Alteromonas flava]
MNSSLSDFHHAVRRDVDHFLTQQIDQLAAHAPQLKSAMQYALLVGGKRMRPVLHNIVADCINAPKNCAIAVSAAIECIHAYSLVHDDLPAMDDDDLRRGQPTCHIKFDEATAILTGDALQTLAFEILSGPATGQLTDTQRLAIIRCLSQASGYQGMCGGQAMDLAATNTRVSTDYLIKLHQLKTGALLKACAITATLLDEHLAESEQQAFAAYAEAIGLAFQIQDDILDVTASSETLGKPAGSDERANKSTFPALLGLTESKAQLQEYHTLALQALDTLPYNTQLLRQFADLMLSRTH